MYDGCPNAYAYDESLQVHIKLKHSGGRKSERKRTMQEMEFCIRNGIEFIPRQNLCTTMLQNVQSLAEKNLANSSSRTSIFDHENVERDSEYLQSSSILGKRLSH